MIQQNYNLLLTEAILVIFCLKYREVEITHSVSSKKKAHPEELIPSKGTQNRWVLITLGNVQPSISFLVQWFTDNRSRSLALASETEKSEHAMQFQERNKSMFSIIHTNCYHLLSTLCQTLFYILSTYFFNP